MPIELGILSFRHLCLRAAPDRLHRIEDFILNDYRRPGFVHDGASWITRFFTSEFAEDRVSHEIGMFSYYAGQRPLVGKIFDPFFGIGRLQLQSNSCASAGPLSVTNGIKAVAGRFPPGRRRLSRFAGHQDYSVGDHKRRIEADSELTDEISKHVFGLGFFDALAQLAGPRFGDCSDIGYYLIAAHADSGVGN